MFSCTSAEAIDDGGARGCLCHRPEIQTLTRRIDASFRDAASSPARGPRSRRSACLAERRAQAATEPPRPIVFTNFLLFDGKSGALREGLRLLVEGGRIKSVAAGARRRPKARARSIAAAGSSCRA